MPMCVESMSILVRKKNAYRKNKPFSTHFCYVFYACYLRNYYVVISYDRRKFLVLVSSKEIG